MNVVEISYSFGFIVAGFGLGWLLGRLFGTVGWIIGGVAGLIVWGGFLRYIKRRCENAVANRRNRRTQAEGRK